jgi:hypothetical protein
MLDAGIPPDLLVLVLGEMPKSYFVPNATKERLVGEIQRV